MAAVVESTREEYLRAIKHEMERASQGRYPMPLYHRIVAVLMCLLAIFMVFFSYNHRLFPVGPTAILLSLFLQIRSHRKGIRRYDRFHAGQCLDCGYDLRSSGQRCSECGQWNYRWEEAKG